MSAKLRIRAREDGDLAVLAEVLRAVYALDGYPVEGVRDARGWLLSDHLIEAWVAECEGRAVGHVALVYGKCQDAAVDVWRQRSGRELSTIATVARLFVAPTARGHGAGGLLLEACEQRARALKLRAVLDVMEKDHAAIRLYESRGWQPIGSFAHTYGNDQVVRAQAYVAPE